MDLILCLLIGTGLVFLSGKDPLMAWIKLRQEGRSLKKTISDILPMFILPWPRTVNKRLLWLSAGFFLIGTCLLEFIARFY
jgi:hypothetical protein